MLTFNWYFRNFKFCFLNLYWCFLNYNFKGCFRNMKKSFGGEKRICLRNCSKIDKLFHKVGKKYQTEVGIILPWYISFIIPDSHSLYLLLCKQIWRGNITSFFLIISPLLYKSFVTLYAWFWKRMCKLYIYSNYTQIS